MNSFLQQESSQQLFVPRKQDGRPRNGPQKGGATDKSPDQPHPLVDNISPHDHLGKRPGRIEITPNGLKFTRTRPAVPKKGGGRRGKVRGFSLAAARRFRELLFRCDFNPRQMIVVGVGLTVPAKASAQVGEDVFKAIRSQQKLLPGLVALLWRKEAQRNRNIHYHIVLWSDVYDSLRTVGALVRMWCRLVSKKCPNPVRTERQMLWSHCKGNSSLLDSELLPPPTEDDGRAREQRLQQLKDLVPCLTPIDRLGQGVDYLLKHGGRYKDYQAKTTGRAWGVWNRSRLPRLPPETSRHSPLSPDDATALARLLRRLDRYPDEDKSSVFGWKWRLCRRFGGGSFIMALARKAEAVRRWLAWRGIEPASLEYMCAYSPNLNAEVSGGARPM